MNVAYIRSSSGDVILASMKESLERPDNQELYLIQSKNFRKSNTDGAKQDRFGFTDAVAANKGLGVHNINPQKHEKGKKEKHAYVISPLR